MVSLEIQSKCGCQLVPISPIPDCRNNVKEREMGEPGGTNSEQWKRNKIEGTVEILEKTKNRNRRLPAHYALRGWDAYAVLMTWIGVCRRIKRYKKLVESAHKRTSPINRTSVRHGYSKPAGLMDIDPTGTDQDKFFLIRIISIPVSNKSIPATTGLYY